VETISSSFIFHKKEENFLISMEGRVHMHWTNVLFLMCLMFMAIRPNVARRLFLIPMDQCNQTACEKACKEILKEKFTKAICYFEKKYCGCFGENFKYVREGIKSK